MAVRLCHLFRKINNTNIGAIFNGSICPQLNNNYSALVSTGAQGQESTEAEPKKKKTSIIPKITLFQGNDISVTTLEEAQKLSKRRDLKLVKVVDLDTKTQRPVYKLMTATEYNREDVKHREEKKKSKEGAIKGEKMLLINYKIEKHDLDVNIKKIVKWIGKLYEVRVVINGDSSKMLKTEEIYSSIESALKGVGRVVQKRVKGTDIKFQVIPPKKDDNNEKKTS